MRAISNSLMAALVIVALFWGNCFSCPQALEALKTHQPHGCCHRSKQTSAGCTTQVLRHFVKADPGVKAPAVSVVAHVVLPGPMVPAVYESAPIAAEHAPPDLLSLHSSFRI